MVADALLVILGVTMWYSQFVYDAHLNTAIPFGFINFLNQTNSSNCLVESQDYGTFWGTWGMLSTVCNMSRFLNDNNPFAFSLWLSPHQCYNSPTGLAAFHALFKYTGFVASIVSLWISVTLWFFYVPVYWLWRRFIHETLRRGFRVGYVSSKVFALLTIPMYLLYVHNRNLTTDDVLPGDIVGILSATLACFTVLQGYVSWQVIRRTARPIYIGLE